MPPKSSKSLRSTKILSGQSKENDEFVPYKQQDGWVRGTEVRKVGHQKYGARRLEKRAKNVKPFGKE